MKRKILSFMFFLTLIALIVSAVGVTPAYAAATLTVTTTANNGAGSLLNGGLDQANLLYRSDYHSNRAFPG